MPTHLPLPPRLRKTGATSLLSHIPSWHTQGQFYMLTTVQVALNTEVNGGFNSGNAHCQSV